eukprot:ANDGO_01306.mRNA.1 hypothetical protein
MSKYSFRELENVTMGNLLAVVHPIWWHYWSLTQNPSDCGLARDVAFNKIPKNHGQFLLQNQEWIFYLQDMKTLFRNYLMRPLCTLVLPTIFSTFLLTAVVTQK